MYIFLIFSFLIWRIYLFLVAEIGALFLPQRLGFLGSSIWANFDGVHYLSIAQNGYMRFQEPFFPLYPILIRFLAETIFLNNYFVAATFISHLSFFVALVFLYKLVQIDWGTKAAKSSVLGILIFPTSFFFASAYTESLFLMFILVSMYMAKKGKWFFVGVFGGLASATRLVGIFLLPSMIWYIRNHRKTIFKNLFLLSIIALGLLAYMWYLRGFVGDPLAFIHSQPAFGAQRTGGDIVLLPQVYWRYLKIFSSVSLENYDLWIAFFEFIFFNFIILTLWYAWKRRINSAYLIFSLLTVIGPTLTGTLSSTPRYTIAAFPIFILYGLIGNKGLKIILTILSFLLLSILTILFTRGYFVA